MSETDATLAPHTDPSNDQPASLVTRAVRGDLPAEIELCRRFAPAARTYARRRLRTRESIDEFTQDVLLLFVEALRAGQIGEPERVGAFVLGICHNVARERARSRDRREALWARFGASFAFDSDERPESRPDDVAHLEDCLSQMTARAREVIRLAYVEGADNPAIASRLEMSPGNVRVFRHRSLETLRECMKRRMSWEAAG
jgi:RNA polymerase sigma-70 factor (ECF subfamily)